MDRGADEFWPGFALTTVFPGRAGESNSISATRAEGGGLLWLFFGTASGRFALPTAACPDLSLQILDPQLLSVSNFEGGVGTYEQFVSLELAGVRLLFQAVAFDAAQPGLGCSVSNLVDFEYP